MNPISLNSENGMFIHFFTSSEKVNSRYPAYSLISKQNRVNGLTQTPSLNSPQTLIFTP